jgi:3',5'-nucleoside bisphosphate phosphatase
MNRRRVRADFHLHSCLSPCASLVLSPAWIVERALEVGLHALALTDHNSALHTPLFLECCDRAGLFGLAGIEVTCAEEAHVLCLFERPEPALALGERLYAEIPPVRCRPDRLGDQVVVNAANEVERLVPHYLASAASITLTELVGWVQTHGGLAIPSHVDRPSCSLGSQLGRIPNLPFAALEVWGTDARHLPPGTDRYACVTFSDTHMPEQLGARWTEFELDTPSLASIAGALEARAFRTCPPLIDAANADA